MTAINIQDTFSKFRLPIPLDQSSPSPALPYCPDEYIDRLLQLLRLLHAIKTSDSSPIASQIRLATNTLRDIEDSLPSIQHHRQFAKSEEERHLFDNIDALVDELRRQVMEVCAAHNQQLAASATSTEEDLIAQIFLMPVDQSPLLQREQDDYEVDLSDNDEHDEKDEAEYPQSNAQHRHPPKQNTIQSNNTTKRNENTATIDPIAFQKEQQSLLETELSTLASRLKSSTLAMNATLKSQTATLTEFESLAQHNLDTVSSTAEKVQQRLVRKKGWKKRLATWSLIGVVVAAWIVCFMIMRTLPKRRIGKFQYPRVLSRFKNEWRMPSFSSGWMAWQSANVNENDITDEVYAEQERRQREMPREQEILQEEQRRHWNEQKGQQWKQRQQGQGCEILPDGTQRCPGDGGNYINPEMRAQQHAAERKRSRIEENMSNAKVVSAVDLDEAAEGKAAAAAAEQQKLEEERAAAEAKRRMEEAERHRKMEEETRAAAEQQARLQREAEENAAAEERKRLEREAEQRRQAEERLQREEDAKATERQRIEDAEIQKRLEEAERQRRLEQEARAAAEQQARSDREALEQQHRREEEAASIRQKRERARIQKDKEAQAAAQRASRERHRAEEAKARQAAEEQGRLQREMEAKAAAERAALERRVQQEELQARQERERIDSIERVRKTAAEQAFVAVKSAKEYGNRATASDSDMETILLPSDVRMAASQRQNDLLARYISQHPEMVDASDGSGWRPIHEAARSGNLGGVQLLIDSGCDLSAKTGRGGSGGTALWWAVQRYGEESDVVRLLRYYDAPEDGPEI